MTRSIPELPLKGFNVGCDIDSIKRFQINQKVCTNCTSCGNELVQKLEDVFEYPVIGEEDGENLYWYWYCDKCDHEMIRKVTINVTIDIKEPDTEETN